MRHLLSSLRKANSAWNSLSATETIYFQEFLPGNEQDTRIVIIGDRCFAATRTNRPGDFRASGSGRLDYDPGKVDPRCREMAFDVAERLGLQSCAFDFLFKAGEPVITEISYLFGKANSSVARFPGYWRRNGAWMEPGLHPAEAQVQDFLELIRRGKE